VGKVSGILLQKKRNFLLLMSNPIRSSASLHQAED
jgi:hypothetical protein